MNYLIGKTYSQDEIDKANLLAYNSEVQLANELGKYKGYHELMFTRASELFKPITSSTGMKAKQDTDDDVIRDIQNDPNLTPAEKLQLMGKVNKIKLEKHTPKEEIKITPAEIREREKTDAFRFQDDDIFGLVPVNADLPGEYMFGFIKLLDSLNMIVPHVDVSNELLVVSNHHRIIIDTENSKIIIGVKQYKGVDIDYPFSKDLLLLLTLNTTDGSDSAKKHYMEIIDNCLESDLNTLKVMNSHRSYNEFLDRVKGNKKFEKWISVKYKIPIRVQPRRAETRGTTSYTDTSVHKQYGDDSEEEGEGIHPGKPIYISPHTNDRIKRAFVLLGNRKSSKEDNADALAEFTSILDSLHSEGSLPINKYKLLMKKWSLN